MSLFRKAESAKMGLKVLAYGNSGEGKSTFGLTFPKIAAIDSESGLAHYEGHENLVLVSNTSSVYDVEDAISEIEDMEGEIGTLCIDSESKIFDSMNVAAMEVEEKRAKKKGGDIEDSVVSMRGFGRIKLLNKKMQNLKIQLSSKGIHIVSIAQLDYIKEKRGEQFVVVGEKPSMGKGVEYDYDVIIKLFTEKQKDGTMGYKALVEKDRTGVTKRGQTIDNPSFDYWKEYCETNSKLKERKVDFATDVEKDIKKMESESDKISALVDDFKVKVKALTPKLQPEVMKKAKELGIDNPLKTNDLKGLETLMEFVNTLA